ncbi:spore cortex biosynthesis protein YabQ [Desulforamulus ruminis]|uniref:spore cortex biosynthesis protein YabQ n=1 Tax=Desulforamulus ruminis TaxID=1564 RepID=UPI002356A7F8|nr:spore cortex biosynthesis protein YabQ [Desulforamulus ruminis]
MVHGLVPLLDQFYYFALTILIGMVAGFCYDLYKVTRGTLKLRRFGTALGDIFFWLILTGVVFILLLLGNWGEVRLYVFLGLALGVILYLNFFSRSTTSLLNLFFRAIRQLGLWLLMLLALIWKALCLPFRILYLMVAVPLGWTAKVLNKVTGRLIGKPVRRLKQKLRNRIASIFPIFEYKDRE